MWRVEYDPKAEKQLGKLGKPQERAIRDWMAENIDGCEDPRAHGKPLVGNLRDYWRYRVGDYRVVCDIRDGELIVVAVKVAHRNVVYRR